MAEVGRDLWRSSSPNPPAQAGSARADCPGPCAVGSVLGFSKDEVSPPPLPAQPIPVFDHPHSKKTVFLCSDRISCALICVHCLMSCHWALLRRVCLVFIPSHQVFLCIDKMPLSLVSSRLNSPGSPSLSSCVRCSKPLISFVTLHRTHFRKSVSFLYWGAQDQTQYSRYGLTSAE